MFRWDVRHVLSRRSRINHFSLEENLLAICDDRDGVEIMRLTKSDGGQIDFSSFKSYEERYLLCQAARSVSCRTLCMDDIEASALSRQTGSLGNRQHRYVQMATPSDSSVGPYVEIIGKTRLFDIPVDMCVFYDSNIGHFVSLISTFSGAVIKLMLYAEIAKITGLQKRAQSLEKHAASAVPKLAVHPSFLGSAFASTLDKDLLLGLSSFVFHKKALL